MAKSANILELNFKSLIRKLPKRPATTHKGNYGHVLVIGGDYGYPGAPVLAALGALRVGAGLVTLASHAQHLLGLNATNPEIMCFAIDQTTQLTTILPKATTIILGPGLGRTAWAQEIYQLVAKCSLPLVLDADGLFFLAQSPSKNIKRVITPHPGEAARLLNQTHPIANDERSTALHDLIAKYGCTVVLKGSGTLIGSPQQAVGICTAGNPGMASGGMGDLLSGVIAGLIAQGLDLDTAAKLGVMVHAKAGDMAAADGQRGIIASDLLLPIKHLIK